MTSYLHHFKTFIEKNLTTYLDAFSADEMVEWVQSSEPQRSAQNIREHLLKRTINYQLRDNNIPPSSEADDLFFMTAPNLFRRYHPGVDPEPFHSGSTNISLHEKRKAPQVKLITTAANVPKRFKIAVEDLDASLGGRSLEDEIVSTSVRAWLDDGDELPWTLLQGVTDDEWFFITTLYGTMTAKGQRTHIRKFYPRLFVSAAKRDMRNFKPAMPEFTGLRSPWMSRRLCRMGELLRQRRITMSNYVANLREIEKTATPYNPMPALDALVMDHRASGPKTLSVFIRDCVQGNCFPIDSRVSNQLAKYGLPEDERLLVGLTLEIGRNPRQVARMFYELG